MTGTEQVLAGSLGPAVSEPFDRSLHSAPTARSTSSGGDGASIRTVDYGQFGSPKNPLGDPPVAVGRRQSLRGPKAARCARRAPARSGRAGASLNGADHPRRSGRPATPCRTIRSRRAPTRTPAGSSPTGCAIPSGSRSSRARASVWIGDVGWNDVGGDRPDRRAPTDPRARISAGPVTRAPAHSPDTRAPAEHLHDDLYSDPASVTRAVYRLQPRRQRRRGRGLPDRRLVDHRPRVLRRRRTYPPTYDGALFFADYSRNCIWVMLPDAGGQPDPRHRRAFDRAAPRRPWTSRSGRAATSSTSTSRAARSTASSTSRRPPSPTARRRIRALAAHGSVRRERVATGQPGDTLTYAWDLTGRHSSTTRRRSTPLKYTTAAATFTVRVQRHRQPRDLERERPARW